MARLPRTVLPGQPLHVIQRGNNRSVIFFADDDYKRYWHDLKAASEKWGCAIHAYVFMTNHVHLLLTPEAESSVSNMMQSLGRRYVRYVNDMYRRSGTLWEGRYKSSMIDSESYLLVCSRYIELNPVRAQMVKDPGDYPWSSYSANSGSKVDNLVQPHACYQALGQTHEHRATRYRDLFNGYFDEIKLGNIREAVNKGWVLGNEQFRGQIEETLRRRIKPYPHGGDRRSDEFQRHRKKARS